MVFFSQASEFFGVGKLREVYEGAMEAIAPHELSDGDVRALGLRYVLGFRV